MKLTGKTLMTIDRCFWLPYRIVSWLSYFFHKLRDDPSGQVLVIKFMGMGSIIRFASLCEEHHVDKNKITLLTISQNREICRILGFNHGWFIRTSNMIHLGLDALKFLGRAKALRPAVIIDYERCSQSAGLYRTGLSWWGKCRTVSFEFKKNISSKRRIVFPIDEFSLEALYLKGMEWMPRQSVNTRKNISVRHKKILININASPYLFARRYPIDSFAEVIRALHQWNSQYEFFLTGSSQEIKYVDQLLHKLHGISIHNVAGQWSLEQLGHELQGCTLFITGDSGPLHLAAYLKVPTLAIWGPTQPGHFGYDNHPYLHHITSRLACSPCFRHPASRPALACSGKIDCLNHLGPKMIIQKAIQVISDSLPPLSSPHLQSQAVKLVVEP